MFHSVCCASVCLRGTRLCVPRRRWSVPLGMYGLRLLYTQARTRQGGGRTKRHKHAQECGTHSECGQSKGQAIKTRAGLQRQNALIRAARSTNKRLKRKLCTIEKNQMKCDDRKYNGERGGEERDGRPSDGDSQSSTNDQRRTGHADEKGGNCKRHRNDMR